MAARPEGGKGSGSGLSIASDMFFTSIAQRDTFTTNNPARKKQGVMCAVTTGGTTSYYQWSEAGNAWASATAVVQGKKGDRGTDGINGTNGVDGAPAPELKFQYSVDGVANWHDGFNTTADKYWRWSTNNGGLFTGPTKIVGEDAPELVIQYSADGATNWLPNAILGLTEFWRWSTDGGNTWSPNYVRYTPASGSTGSGFPAPYEADVDGLGNLLVKQGGELIYTQNAGVTKYKGKVEAGWEGFSVPGHTLGSAGENFVFVNNNDNTVYFPPWSSVSKSGNVVNQPTVRVHGASLQYMEVNGASSNAPTVVASFTTQPSVSAVFFDLTFLAGEAYTGRLYLEQRNSAGDLVLSNVELPQATYVVGTPITIPFAFPMWLQQGQAIQIKLFKEGNALMKVKVGQTDTTKPWRRSAYRTYTEQPILTTENPLKIVESLVTLTNNDRLPASAIKDFPVASGTQLGMIKLGTGLSIDGQGKLNNTSTAAKKVVVSSQAAMLALPLISNLYIVNRTDTQTNWYLNADQDPSVLANWAQGEYTGNAVVSFKGRYGSVVPEYGDYNSTLVPIADQDNSAIKYVIAVKNGQLGIIRTE